MRTLRVLGIGHLLGHQLKGEGDRRISLLGRLIEDAIAIGLVWFATQYPFVAAGLVAVLLVMVAAALRLVVRALRWSFGRRPRPEPRP